MKNIYLNVKNKWVLFEYVSSNDLSERNITIGEWATIGERATIGEWARIGEGATIGERARIGKEATIGEWATIGKEATIGEGATIGERARIGKEATIGEKIDLTGVHAICIVGSKHTVNYWGANKIAIGCYVKTFDEWKDEYEEVGENNDYSEAQIDEYKKYIDFISSYYSK